MNTIRRAVARIGGNFGVSFLGPLSSGSLVQSVYQGVVTIEQIVVMSLLSSAIVTSLVFAQEVQAFGYGKKSS